MDCVWEHLHTRLLDELFEGEGGQTPLQQVQYSNIHLFNDVNTRSKKKITLVYLEQEGVC